MSGFYRRLLSLIVLLAPLTLVGCTEDMEHAGLDGTIKSDGWALFSVDNDRQQHNDVAVTIRDADPGATYVLIYAPIAPPNAGWFLFDPASRERCGGDIGPHCEIYGYGYMVDVQTAGDDGGEITLRDDQCGCDGDHPKTGWTGHWAVMRVERTDRSVPVRIDVWAKAIREYAVEPDIQQLQ